MSVQAMRKELAEYVAFRGRNGTEISFQQAVRDHRLQVVENLRDDPHGPWRDRLRWLDELLREEGLTP